MRDDLKENIKLSAQKSVPFLLSLIFILLNYTPSFFGISSMIHPAVGAICVFYWVLHRPDLFNLFTVFFLGFVSDTMSAAPLGVDIVSYLMIYLLVSHFSALFNNKPFSFVWSGFVFIFVSTELVKWLVISVYYASFLPLGILFFTVLFTIACYPVISIINDFARKFLMNDEG